MLGRAIGQSNLKQQACRPLANPALGRFCQRRHKRWSQRQAFHPIAFAEQDSEGRKCLGHELPTVTVVLYNVNHEGAPWPADTEQRRSQPATTAWLLAPALLLEPDLHEVAQKDGQAFEKLIASRCYLVFAMPPGTFHAAHARATGQRVPGRQQ